MPLYCYEFKGKKIEIYQSMNDEHVFVDEFGNKWNRVWFSPQASVDTKIDIFNSKDFVNKSVVKKGTIGDLVDTSKELSEKRAAKMGKDPFKEKYLNNWSKRRKGRPHPDVARQEAKKFAAKNGFDLEY